MTEKYILVSDDEYCYTLDTQSENYKTLEYFEKAEFEDAKKNGIDINDYEDAILESANDKYWDWIYENHLEADTVNDIMNEQHETIISLKKELFEAKKECIWATSDEVDRVLYFEDEVKELAEDLGIDLNDWKD